MSWLWRKSRINWLVLAGLWLLTAAVMWRRMDPDFGWHLQAGRYILAHGIPRHDVFTYTAPNYPWINHEWLSDVIISGIMSAGGYVLAAAVFAGIWVGALRLAARTWSWPVLGLGYSMLIGSAAVRPNAWTALFFAVTLVAIDRGWRWRLVPLFGLWANLHGGFLIGLAALALAGWKDRRYLGVLAVAVLATFVNPYGPRLYGEILGIATDSQLHTRIAEWLPLRLDVATGLYILAFLAVVIASGWRRHKFLLPGLLLLASIDSQRQFSMFVLSSLKSLGEGYEVGRKFLNITGRKQWLVAVVGLSMAVGAAVVWVVSPGNVLPDHELADLRTRPCSGQLYAEYNFGGYIMWQLPGTKVFVDGRMPSWREGGVSYYDKWHAVIADATVADREFARYDVKCALLLHGRTRLLKQLVREGWRVSSQDVNAVLLRRPE